MKTLLSVCGIYIFVPLNECIMDQIIRTNKAFLFFVLVCLAVSSVAFGSNHHFSLCISVTYFKYHTLYV